MKTCDLKRSSEIISKYWQQNRWIR